MSNAPKYPTIDLAKQAHDARTLLAWGIARLTEEGIESPQLQTEILLSHSFRIPRNKIADQIIPSGVAEAYIIGIERLCRHEPLQYVTSDTVFMGFPLVLSPDVLIPRPETELLAEIVINRFKGRSEPVLGVDIGTGSGNLPVAICRFLSTAKMYALDNSKPALEVARKNFELNGVTDRVITVYGDALKLNHGALPTGLDFLVSNPPYISSSEYELLDARVRDFEPRDALTDGGDGLSFYRQIAKIVLSHLKNGGWVDVEVAFDQATAVSAIFAGAGLENIAVAKDYAKIDRFVSAQVP